MSKMIRPRSKAGKAIGLHRSLRIEPLESRCLLSAAPFISEVNAANSTGILDAAGATSDWLEVCNPDPTASVSLAGWSLNYQKTGSSKSTTWTVPINDNLVLGPGESRVIFCDSTSATDPDARAAYELQSQQGRRYGRVDQRVQQRHFDAHVSRLDF